MTFLGYGCMALLCVIVLAALLMWWDFCAWRKARGRDLTASHWLTGGDYPDSTTTEDAE